MITSLVITCEHAVNTIPAAFSQYFKGFEDVLKTHEGIDLGALDIALYFKHHLTCEFVQAKVSRFLIDCNRSLWHKTCFSRASQALSCGEKKHIIETYYLPYRHAVMEHIQSKINLKQRVLHLSIHSFTPLFNGSLRLADIGFLYDPKRTHESQLAKSWQACLHTLAKDLRIRRNYPYKGNSDGFTTFLRKQFGEDEYLGIEVETNQAMAQQDAVRKRIESLLVSSLIKIMGT